MMRFKRSLATLLIMVLVFGSIPIRAYAYTDAITIEINGTYEQVTNTIGTGGTEYGGNNLKDAISKAGQSATIKQLKITNGEFTTADWEDITDLTAMTNFEIASLVTVASMPDGATSDDPIFPSCIVSVQIPQATPVGNNAFYSATALTTVSMPEATTIGNTAFYSCSALTTVRFLNVTTIDIAAFVGCVALDVSDFPKAITINASAFYGCQALTNADFPKVETIGLNAFQDCQRLITASFPEVTNIGEKAFYQCEALTTADFPKAETIGLNAFDKCKGLITANFPEVTNIGEKAFYQCEALTTADFPKTETIGLNAFNNCKGLITVSFPKVTNIDEKVFYQCEALTIANFPNATTIGYCAFQNCKALTTVNFPNATTIDQYAFADCKALTTANFRNVTTISNVAFWGCVSLTTLKLGATAPSATFMAFLQTPKTNPLVFLNKDGTELTDVALTTAQNSYKAASDGNTSDNLWYGWIIMPIATLTIEKTITIGTIAPVKDASIEEGTNTPPTGAAAPVVTWSDDGGLTWTASGSFAADTAYKTKYVYTASTGYVFDSAIAKSDITVTNLGSGIKTVELSDSNKTLAITVTWPKTATSTAASSYGEFTVITADIEPTYENNTLTFGNAGTYDVKTKDGISQTTVDKILVDSEGTVNITLNGVVIDVSEQSDVCAFNIQGSSVVNLTIKDGTTNTLKSGNNCAGLFVQTTATVTIDGKGTLNTTGGFNGAGIGSDFRNQGGSITINDGTIFANGGSFAAGIGGGNSKAGGRTIINGGIVKAAGSQGAGIGGGAGGAGGDITISGGIVTAISLGVSGQGSGAGIGGGKDGLGGSIKIDDDATVIAVSDVSEGSNYAISLGEIGTSGLSGKTVANILMANYAEIVSAHTKTSVKNEDGDIEIVSYTPSVQYRSIAFTVPSAENYTIYKGTTLLANGGTTNNVFNVASSGLNTFIDVQECTADLTSPTVSSLTPANGDIGINLSGNIVITFDEAMDAATGEVQLNSLAMLTDGSWSNGNKIYTIAYIGLVNSTSYTVKITGFKDAAGNDLAENTRNSFTTVSETTVPSLEAGVVIRTSDTTATVKFTSKEAGTYYYNIGSAVTDTSTGGTAYLEGITTISLTNLTAGAQEIYIVVKDAEENMSADSFKIAIQAYVLGLYSVTGAVNDNLGSVVIGASVKLKKGNTQIGTQGVNTNSSGEFTITGVPNGTYNLVVEKNSIIVTTKVVVNSTDYTISDTIKLPAGKTNSVVEVKENTPPVVVGGLDDQFDAPMADDKDKGITLADNTVVTNGGSVEIKLTAEKKDDMATNATTISAIATLSSKTVGIFMDLSVLKTVKNSGGAEITSQSAILTELPNLIDVFIPLPTALQGQSNYVVYRYHASAVDSITTMANAEGEKIELVDNNTTIKLTVKKFSTYAVAYTMPTTPHTGGGSSSSVVASMITAVQSEGGKITISTDKNTATITPDDGYVIADVMVDGKSIGTAEAYTDTDSSKHIITTVFVKDTALPYYFENDQKVYIGFSAIVGNLYQCVAPAGVTVEFMENPKNFMDNTIAWAKTSIDFVTEREIFLGTSQDTFSPNESMTRAMFVTAIGRLYERSYGSVSGTNTFSDVDVNAYYAKYVAWANEKGLIKGIGENQFAPDEKVTREQMAVIMLNFATLLKKADVLDSSLGYADSASISSWAMDGATYCQETKVITGRSGGNFAPQESATRAEVAVVIDRFIKTIMQ